MSTERVVYKVYIMFHKNLSPSLDEYSEDLRGMYSEGGAKAPEVSVLKNGCTLEVTFEGLTFFVKANQSKQVRSDSVQLAEKAWPEEQEEQEELRKSVYRYEITSTIDKEFKHSVELLLLIQAAASFGKIWAYDFTVDSFT